MAHRIDKKQAAREARLRAAEEARRDAQREKVVRFAGGGIVAAIAVVLVVMAVALNGNTSSASVAGSITSGPVVGRTAPGFTATDVVSRKKVTLASLRGHKTMMFFSEGVGCQACMVQIGDLQKVGDLQKAGIQLVSVTTDQPSDLTSAAQQYGITTPLLADPRTSMSAAYGMLGHGGMQHPTQDGHAFMLLGADGKVLWHHGYEEMYVKPSQLMADMNARVGDAPNMGGGMGS
jgi:peroxiredoxin